MVRCKDGKVESIQGKSGRKRLAIIAVAFALSATTLLVACVNSNHEVIPAGKECISCHEEKATYEVDSPKGAVETTGDVTVTLKGADKVKVCKVIFTSEDGSHFTPVEYRSATVVDGQPTTVTLEEGTWALVAPDSYAHQLVIVSPSADADSPSVTLKD